eukprot:TRINITY_DN15358_c0_g1_i1.p1 TRINITY_DN15358_c0_g1~~TRINITY_DN15358_c0_g1_i1.p1  ORF type:complete len:888 (+),score=150.98 TRINITY_DN15358_c0_g1_i1:52-2664(+)
MPHPALREEDLEATSEEPLRTVHFEAGETAVRDPIQEDGSTVPSATTEDMPEADKQTKLRPSSAQTTSATSSHSSDIACVVPGKLDSQVHFLDESHLGVITSASNESDHDWKEFEAAAFKDQRWENAMKHLRDRGLCANEDDAISMLRDGAKSFGLWHVSKPSLQALAQHLLKDCEPDVTPALQVWLDSQATLETSGDMVAQKSARPQNGRRARSLASITECEMKRAASERGRTRFFGLLTTARKQKLGLLLVVIGCSIAFSVTQCNKEMINVLGPFILLARAAGIAALMFTVTLFLTMSRTLLNVLYRLVPPHFRLCRVLDSFTSLHIFSGQMTFVMGCLHVFAHLLSTYSALEREPVEDLNQVLKCAQADRWTFKDAFATNFPHCPIERNLSLTESLFLTTAGITGIGLLLVISIIAYTAKQKRRDKSFETFYYVHLFFSAFWVVLLFLHGMQGWIGIAVPLVLPVCALPALLIIYDKVLRVLRFYLYRHAKVRILSAIIRPGADGGPCGALTALKIKKPPYLWTMRDGMYAFVAMPEYSSWQWHPFTIISGRESDTVDFIISGLGDWTQELAQRALDFKRGLCDELPAVALDGPYSAPTATALACKVLIAVGSGIGITPFLALMSQLIAALSREEEEDQDAALPLKEAHVFWIARSADEFLFGRLHFTRIISRSHMRDRIFLHLHLTHKESSRDGPGFLFREALRRQSIIDRNAFAHKRRDTTNLMPSPQLPWCWVNGSSLDVLWVGIMSEALGDQEEQELANSCQVHWDSKSRCGTTRSFSSSSACLEHAGQRLDAMLPICLGRPDWRCEIQAVGKAWPSEDIHVYVCGSNAVVDALQDVCRVCNSHAQKARRLQRYILRRETFGK